MDSFLRIRGLKKHFGDKRVLDGIDLDVAAASVTTIIGKSGIGKSVLLKCIANLLQPDAGTIELDGQAISQSRRTAQSDAGVSFSYMFQNNALFDSLTAFEPAFLTSAAPMAAAGNRCGNAIGLGINPVYAIPFARPCLAPGQRRPAQRLLRSQRRCPSPE